MLWKFLFRLNKGRHIFLLSRHHWCHTASSATPGNTTPHHKHTFYPENTHFHHHEVTDHHSYTHHHYTLVRHVHHPTYYAYGIYGEQEEYFYGDNTSISPSFGLFQPFDPTLSPTLHTPHTTSPFRPIDNIDRPCIVQQQWQHDPTLSPAFSTPSVVTDDEDNCPTPTSPQSPPVVYDDSSDDDSVPELVETYYSSSPLPPLERITPPVG